MTNAVRQRLATRRRQLTFDLDFQAGSGGGLPLTVSIGFFDDGRPGECFITGPKSGSQMNALLHDAAILISRALQAGQTPADLARSMCRVPAAPDPGLTNEPGEAERPASAIGAVLEALCALSVTQ